MLCSSSSHSFLLFLCLSTPLPLPPQLTSLSCTVIPSAPSRRLSLRSALCTPRTPVSTMVSTPTCDSTTGALLSTWTRPWQSSGPASWSAPLNPPPPPMSVKAFFLYYILNEKLVQRMTAKTNLWTKFSGFLFHMETRSKHLNHICDVKVHRFRPWARLYLLWDGARPK